MGNCDLIHFKPMFLLLSILLIMITQSTASVRRIGKLSPNFTGAEMTWVDNDGLFLLSNNSIFGFGFCTTQDVTLFVLSIVHMGSKTAVWSANRGSPVHNSDNFSFDESGNAFLVSGNDVVWSTNSGNKGVSEMELLDSGNLVLRTKDSNIIWQSFSYPTNTLLTNQNFTQGMKLVSDVETRYNLSYFLEINSSDMVLYANYQIPQPYWSMGKDNRRIVNKNGGGVKLSSISANSWRFYDENEVLLWQFTFSDNTDANAMWIAVLGTDGLVSFSLLQSGGTGKSPTQIPKDSCSTPQSCDAYYTCATGHTCNCPLGLGSRNCKTGIKSPCSRSNGPTELVELGSNLHYFALDFVSPFSKTDDLDECKTSCLNKCSCLAMFFQNSSKHCFHFDQIGSFESSTSDNTFFSFVKVSSDGGSDGASDGNGSGFPYVVIIVIGTIFIISGLIFGFYMYYRKKKNVSSEHKDSSEEDNFLESLSGMPIRFTYKELEKATNEFSIKLGQGGFGSVYRGDLSDGTRIAVKQLEGIGQGKKEFRAEVSIIGSIHHLHLVKLKGFCAEGSHRLLVYEFMANGSLDKWIFKRKNGEFLLDWNARFSIAVGTAKGLAYLHEDCDHKIVHCDIKPENVLLDDNFHAKVSDFGLAKLMTREQSHVFTTMRGTRGYLAPEWITSYAISEKSDVYSYGMVLLEIVGGRKNYDPSENSEKSHFPSYAFKMMEEGKLREILDSKLKINDEDERIGIAIKVALWCIQDDMHLRPSMTKVVQMLEGICSVAPPPTASQMGSRLYSGFFKSISEEGTSSGPSDCNSDAYLSAVRLSGPR